MGEYNRQEELDGWYYICILLMILVMLFGVLYVTAGCDLVGCPSNGGAIEAMPLRGLR